MASILQIGPKWRAQVRRAGMSPQTKTFTEKDQAEQWAQAIDRALSVANSNAASVAIHHQEWVNLLGAAPMVSGLPAEVAALPRMDMSQSCGVYFLFLKGQCVYVGQSNNVFGRIRGHHPSKEFDSFSWMVVAPSDLNSVEQGYIKTIRPCLNLMYNKPVSGN